MKNKISILSAAAILFAANLSDAQEKTINVDVDVSKSAGIIKPLNGGNLAEKISSTAAGNPVTEYIAELNMPLIRLHDVPLQNAGLRIVDTDLIFPNMHADENDPRNYCFAPTDDYIAECQKTGANVVYRLGVSIDHSVRKYRTAPPDLEKWAKVCIKIIEHLNEGWAEGHNFGIKYFEIWNEPDGKSRSGKNFQWGGSLEHFADFYAKTAKIIKARFPHIKIGGPAFCYFNKNTFGMFLDKVKAENAPLDFFSWHKYSDSVEKYIAEPAAVRKFFDERGFKNTELHLNEWHPMYVPWSGLRRFRDNPDFEKNVSNMTSHEIGVAACSILIGWQDTPLDHAMFYSTGTFGRNWTMFTENGLPVKLYYPFKAFGQMNKFPRRLVAKSDNKNAYALAGKDGNGRRAVLVSLYKTGKNTLAINIPGADLSKAEILVCDGVKNLEPAGNAKISDGKIEIPVAADSAAVLVKF